MATRYVMYSRSNYQLTTSCQNCRGIHLQASDSIPEAYLSRRLALNLWSLPQVPPVDVPRLFPPSTLSRYHYSTINSLILITIADNSPSDPTPKSHPSLCLAFALLRHYPGTIDPLSTHWFSSQSLTIHPQIPCQSPTCQCILPFPSCCSIHYSQISSITCDPCCRFGEIIDFSITCDLCFKSLGQCRESFNIKNTFSGFMN